MSFAFVLAHLLASSAFAARPPEIDLAPGDASVLRATFTEGDPPLALTTGALTAGVSGGAPLVRAVVRVANPLDAPLERLGVTASYAEWYLVHGADAPEGPDDVDVDVDATASGPGVTLETVAATATRPSAWHRRVRVVSDPDAGILTVDAPLRRGEKILDAVHSPTTHAIRDALRNVTYAHAGRRPDDTVRGVSFEVYDANGVASPPAAVLVDVVAVNDPPVLDLNGAHRPGVDYAAVMGENERRVGVMLADADAHVGDDDGDFLRGARVYREGADPFPDGDAESVAMTLDGTSVTGAWDPSSGSFVLVGRDTLAAYRRVLASARYVNEGAMRASPDGVFGSSELVFTGGARRFVFEVTDADGAVAVARSTVTVSEMRRVGDPSRDENQASPPECSGAGYRDVDDELGTGDPEACVCDPGFEGDRCELHPCNDRGELVFFDAQTGEKTCECRREFGGATCDVECRGNGAFDARTETCACRPGFAGILCDVACDGCDGAHGRCALTNASAASWSDADEAYEIVETTCECSDEYMGANCTIPCPCAPGAFGRGACVVDSLEAAGAYGDVTDEELGECACDPGWVGEDCSVPCPACVANQGDCAPPPGFEKGVGRALADVDADVTHVSEAARRAALDAIRVEGICACRETQTNDLGGEGYAGADCSVPCAPCAFGTCAADGSCACAPGFVGDACDVECSGNGVLVFPEFNATNDVSAFDALPGVPGNERMETSGLIHAATLYGATSYPGGENRTFAYCACGFARDAETGDLTPIPTEELGVNNRGGVGYVGVFCETPCAPCDAANGKCVFDGADGACECRRDAPNDATSASRLVAEGETGFGFTGPACDVPCEPCYNGTCSNEPGSYGQCLCDPGFADPACLIECGDPGFARVADVVAGADDGASFGQSIVDISQGGVYIGSRGRVNTTGAAPGEGLLGTTTTCECEYMWTGPLCSHACPYPYDVEHGACVVKDPDDEDYGDPWTTEIVCEPGWTGLPEEYLRLPSGALSRGRNCSAPCLPCVHGTCQDDGTCLCEYGYVWQGPLFEGSDVGVTEAVHPFPLADDPMVVYEPEYHTCAARHPCNMNGELFNATCGPAASPGYADNLTLWTTLDPERGGGYGCTGEIVNGTMCVDPTTGEDAPNLFAMAYAQWDSFTESFIRTETTARAFATWGLIQGGYCASDVAEEGQPLHGGYCVCDSIRNGRFQHPSARTRDTGGYDYYFQGWAGSRCETPCAPCSKNGLCDAATGKCECFEGWTGYRCLTPCEPCEHGTCQYDGTCLCDGARRLAEGTYALRLTRDPFFLEKGLHAFEAQGERRSRYVHPVYMHTYDLEDYVWELEYECPNREQCAGRTQDTHLPTRPNETYFRYTTPNIVAVLEVNDELEKLRAYRDSLVTDVEGTPFTMESDEICDETDDFNEVTNGACLRRMRDGLFGRTTQGCGADWDSVRPWDCDDVVKSHFVRERNLELGNVEVRYLGLQQSTGAENVWFANNVNERQRLINTMTRGRFNATRGEFQTIRDPDYYFVWIVHQLIHGVTSGDGYTGWNCAVKCDACDPDHGTCQFDGTCECVDGWYGPSCDRKCDCFRHVAVKNALELSNLAEDVLLESIDSHSGFPIQPHGTCQRDGTCECYADPDGTRWTGVDCFTKCKPCSNGECAPDGSCACRDGWTGDDCSTPTFVECLPCDDAHGACLSDGTCKCDRGWTGLDCSIECSPCAHGDCAMDGSCHCRPGWTLPDCSKKIPPGAWRVRSDFSLGSEGWRSHNNSCAGVLETIVSNVPEIGHPDAVAKAIRGACANDGDGGDGGVEWDGAAGHLYLTDRLPSDGDGEIAYFRAPGKFLGDVLSTAYDGTLSYELYLAGGGDASRGAGAPVGVPHAPDTDAERAPDVILVGGRPRYGLDLPPWDVGINTRRTSGVARISGAGAQPSVEQTWRLVDVVEAYLDTPQVVLGIRAPRGGKHHPPGACVAEHCSVNFNFDLREDAGWVNLATTPSGFGWFSDGDDDENARERGPGWIRAVEGTEYVGKAPGAPYDPFAGIVPGDIATYPDGVPVPDPSASVASRGDAGAPAWIWERGDGARVPSRGDPFVHAAAVAAGADGVPKGAYYEGADAASIAASLAAAFPNGAPPGTQGAYPSGTYPGGGAFAGTWWAGEVDNDNSAWRVSDESWRRWDLPPEVYAAIQTNRASRVGENASFTDLAWCLASLTEILIRADYYETPRRRRRKNAMGPGETVRLDHVMLSAKDPHADDPGVWIAREHAAFMAYVDRYARDYEVQFLAEYFAEYAEALRLSVCRGNGVYANGEDDADGCACDDAWRGTECELPCPACVHGACALAPNGEAAACECEPGWAGTLCDVECPPCDYERATCATDDTTGLPSCACEHGFGGAYCQHACPPCDYEHATCDERTYSGAFPGDAATCECVDKKTRAGLLCELECPGTAPEYCGNGECRHALWGMTYASTTEAERRADVAACECDVGWIGIYCDDPCPGGPSHPDAPGPAPCLGRGSCAVGSGGTAQCVCVSGYVGVSCETELGICGDGVINAARGEECDDGNSATFRRVRRELSRGTKLGVRARGAIGYRGGGGGGDGAHLRVRVSGGVLAHTRVSGGVKRILR